MPLGPFASYVPPGFSSHLAFVKVVDGAGHVLGKVSGSMWGELPVADGAADGKKSFGRDFRCKRCGSLLHLLKDRPGLFCVVMISMRGDNDGISRLSCGEALVKSVMDR